MDLILFIAMDEGIDINNVVNIIGENLGHPLPDNNNRIRHQLSRNENYFVCTIPRYTDMQFFENFRMSRGTFEDLLNVVAPTIAYQQNVNVSISKKLLFTIWTLAKPESFLTVGDRFGLAKSTGHQIFSNVVGACYVLRSRVEHSGFSKKKRECVNKIKKKGLNYDIISSAKLIESYRRI